MNKIWLKFNATNLGGWIEAVNFCDTGYIYSRSFLPLLTKCYDFRYHYGMTRLKGVTAYSSTVDHFSHFSQNVTTLRFIDQNWGSARFARSALKM